MVSGYERTQVYVHQMSHDVFNSHLIPTITYESARKYMGEKVTVDKKRQGTRALAPYPKQEKTNKAACIAIPPANPLARQHIPGGMVCGGDFGAGVDDDAS